MSISTELVDYYVDKSQADLARLMGAEDPNSVTVIDNSIMASFVSRRLKHGEYEGLNLAQVWAIEEGFRKKFMSSLEDRHTFPPETRREYGAGLRRLEELKDDPLEALRFRWNLPELEVSYSPKTYELARQQLNDFISGSHDCKAAFMSFTSDAYFRQSDWEKHRKVGGVIRRMARDLKVKRGEPTKIYGQNNDADIFTMAYVISYGAPAQILTGDRHFFGIQTETYRNIGLIAAKTDTVGPRHLVNIVYDGVKEPEVRRPATVEI